MDCKPYPKGHKFFILVWKVQRTFRSCKMFFKRCLLESSQKILGNSLIFREKVRRTSTSQMPMEYWEKAETFQGFSIRVNTPKIINLQKNHGFSTVNAGLIFYFFLNCELDGRKLILLDDTCIMTGLQACFLFMESCCHKDAESSHFRIYL